MRKIRHFIRHQFNSNIVNFSEDEARNFIDANNLNEMDFNQLKQMTNFNPLLLERVTNSKRRHWKNMMTYLNNIFILQTHAISTFDAADRKSKIDFLK